MEINLNSLAQREDWRWSKCEKLPDFSKLRKNNPSFQFSHEEGLEFCESFADFSPLEQNSLQKLEQISSANPFAALALQDENSGVLRFRIEQDTQEPINIYCNAQNRRLELSRVEISVAAGVKSAICLDFLAQNSAVQIPLILLHLAADAECEFLFLGQNQGDCAAQILQITAEQKENSQLKINLCGMGEFFRTDLCTELSGEGANFSFAAAQKTSGDEINDLHVQVKHRSPNCKSRQIVRGVLAEKSRSIFDGLIFVDKAAQKTDAEQSSRYVLLDQKAQSLAIPRLEIYADDVQCAHGSSTGELDAQALFYLQSRGIDAQSAKNILTTALLAETKQFKNQELAAIWSEIIT